MAIKYPVKVHATILGDKGLSPTALGAQPLDVNPLRPREYSCFLAENTVLVCVLVQEFPYSRPFDPDDLPYPLSQGLVFSLALSFVGPLSSECAADCTTSPGALSINQRRRLI